MKTIQDTPAWHGRNRYGRRFERLDIHAQAQVLVEIFGRCDLHRDRTIGNATVEARAFAIHQAISDLKGAGYTIRNLLNLDQRHIRAIVGSWVSKELSASTMQTRMSLLRWICTALGKRGMLQDITCYGVDADRVRRDYVARHDKSWTTNNVIPAEKIAEAHVIDEWVAMQLDLMRVYGLRMQEAIMLRPRDADKGSTLVVVDGTKGGRMRILQIHTEAQRAVLDAARLLSQRTAIGSLCRPGKNISQAIRRFYYVCERLGITKAQLGVTSHGLRHEFANDRYERLSGVPSAVRGGGRISDRIADERARQQVSQDLGHARTSITASYTGARTRGRPRNSALPAPFDGGAARGDAPPSVPGTTE